MYEPENVANPEPLRVPDRITAEWLQEALNKGKVVYNGRELFVRQHDPSMDETDWLQENYGVVEVGTKESKTYVYHAAPAELITSYLEHGLFATPESVNLSGIRREQVDNAARYEGGSIGYSAVLVWRTPWSNLQYRGGYNEHYYTPTKVYSGSSDSLPADLPKHLKQSNDLRVLPADDIIGIYINKAE